MDDLAKGKYATGYNQGTWYMKYGPPYDVITGRA